MTGVCIPGKYMKFPKACAECKFGGGYLSCCHLTHESFFWVVEDGQLYNPLTWKRREFDFTEERLPDCPLIPMVIGIDAGKEDGQ